MKYLFLLTIFLTSCSTPRIAEPLVKFECAVVGGHGVYAHITGEFESQGAAEEQAEKIRLYLVKEQKVPDTTSVFCYEI